MRCFLETVNIVINIILIVLFMFTIIMLVVTSAIDSKTQKIIAENNLQRTKKNSSRILFAEISKVNPKAQLPEKGSRLSAGFDLHACLDEPIEVRPEGTVMIPTGLAIAPPSGYFGAIFARSGLAAKQGLRPANCVGVCDEDYRGEYMVALHNDSNTPRVINPGDRIAQLVFLPYPQMVAFVNKDSLDNTERGSGGFGSTGT